MFTPEFKSFPLDVSEPLALAAMDLVQGQVLGSASTNQELLLNYQKRGDHFYALVTGQELLGVGSFTFRGAAASIGVLAVMLKYQRQPGGQRYGFGSTIVGGLEQEAQRLQPETARMTVYAHPSAIEFYRNLGYQHVYPQSESASMFKGLYSIY